MYITRRYYGVKFAKCTNNSITCVFQSFSLTREMMNVIYTTVEVTVGQNSITRSEPQQLNSQHNPFGALQIAARSFLLEPIA